MISTYVRSAMADQIQNAAAVAAAGSSPNNPNGAQTASKLCGWPLANWAKSLAYVETVVGFITLVIIPIFLVELSSVKNSLVVRDGSATKEFNNKRSSSFFVMMGTTVGISTSKITESQYDYVQGYFITLMLLQLAFTVLAIYVVIGVTKKNLKHILQGIFFKGALLLLNVLFFLCQLIVLACCGYDSSILWRLFLMVGDGMFIMVLNNYFKYEKEALAAANLNDQLPKFMAGLANNMFSIKMPFFMSKK